MLYELRFYNVAPGRMPENHERHRTGLPPLFARHGIEVVGRWTATAGPDTPLFAYLMSYPDLAERERQWTAFYDDADWWALRTKTNAGSEMVERYDLMFLRPHPRLSPATITPGERLGGVHELVFLEVGAGLGSQAGQFLETALLPAILRQGGRVMMVADLMTGPRLPRMALMIAWSDAEAAFRGRMAVDADQLVLAAQQVERQNGGKTALGRADIYGLEPAAYALPFAALGAKA